MESITYLLQYSTMQLMVLVGFPGCLLDLEQTGLTKVLSECRGLTVLPSLSLLLLFPLLASPPPSLCPPSPLPTPALSLSASIITYCQFWSQVLCRVGLLSRGGHFSRLPALHGGLVTQKGLNAKF